MLLRLDLVRKGRRHCRQLHGEDRLRDFFRRAFDMPRLFAVGAAIQGNLYVRWVE